MQGTIAEQYSLNPVGLIASLRTAGRAELLNKAIFYSLLVLIALTAIPYGTIDPWWDALFQCGIFTLTVLWAIEGWLTKTWRLSGHRLLLPLAILTFFAFAQTLPLWGANNPLPGIEGSGWRALSFDPYETRRAAFKMLAMVLTLGLLLRYTSTLRRLRALIYVVIMIGVASALFGIGRYVAQRSGLEVAVPYLTQSSSFAQFINRNHFAFLMEMVLGLMLGLIVGGDARRHRGRSLLYLLGTLSVLITLVLAGSRGALFGVFSQVLFLAMLLGVVHPAAASEAKERTPARGGRTRQQRRLPYGLILRIVLGVCLVATIMIGIVKVGDSPVVSFLRAAPTEFVANEEKSQIRMRRVDVWRATWQLIKNNAIVGVGFGGYEMAMLEHDRTADKYSLPHAHNNYLELVASGGLISAALALWFIGAFVVRARRQLNGSVNPYRRTACYGALAGLTGVAVHSLLGSGLHITVNALVFITLLAIATVSVRGRRDDDPEQHENPETEPFPAAV